MPFPYDTATLDAINRLANFYNGGNYSSSTNPGGFGLGGHRINFIPALDDVALVIDSAGDAATAAGNSATSAANSATLSGNQAASLEGTSTTNVAIGLGAKSFTTQTNKAFNVGTYMFVVLESSPLTHFMEGQVTSYNAGTGALTINVVVTSGVGTFGDWQLFARAGPPGAQGLAGNLGPAGPAAGVRWTFVAGTTDTDPGPGKFAFNNATVSAVTQIYVDDVDFFGATQTAFLDSFDDSTNTPNQGSLFIQATNVANVYAMFNVTGSVVAGTGYRKIPVTHVASFGAFNATITASLVFSRAGDKGLDGAGAGNVTSASPSVVANHLVVWNDISGTVIKTAAVGISNVGINVPLLSGVNTWTGKQTISAGLAADQAFQLSGGLTPPVLTTDAHDYNPTGNDNASVWRLSANAARQITGILGGTDGRLLVTQNVGSFPISFPNNSASSTANNRFLTGTGATVTINTNQAITWLYDATSGWWRALTAFGVSAATAFGTDNTVLRADGTGNGIQASNASIDDPGNMVVQGFFAANGGAIQSTSTTAIATLTTLRNQPGHGAVGIGAINFQGIALPSTITTYASILATCLNDAAATRNSQLAFSIFANNTFNSYFRLTGSASGADAIFDAPVTTSKASFVNQGTGLVPTYTSSRLDAHGGLGAVVAALDFYGKNFGGITTQYGLIQLLCDDTSTGVEDTHWVMKSRTNGVMVDAGLLQRRVLLADHTVYVRNDATSDAARDGSTDTVANAFKTWQGAINYVQANIYTNGFNVKFKMGGTSNIFTQAVSVISCTSPMVGGGIRIFEGKPIGVGTSADCEVKTTASNARVLTFTNAGNIIFTGQWRVSPSADGFGLMNNGFTSITNNGHLHFFGNAETFLQQQQEGAYFSNLPDDPPATTGLIWFDGNAIDNCIRNDSGTFHDNGTMILKGNNRTFDAFYRGDFFSQGYLSANLAAEGTGHVGDKVNLGHRAAVLLYSTARNVLTRVPGNTRGNVQQGSVINDQFWNRPYNVVQGTAIITTGTDNVNVTFNPNYSDQPDTNYMVTFDSSVNGRFYTLNSRAATGFNIRGNAAAAANETIRWRLEWLPQ